MPAAAAPAHSGALGIATLFSWLLTAGIGVYMLRSVVAYDGLRQQRTVRGGLSPRVLIGHFSLAIAGLVVWIGFLATGWAALAWLAVCLLMPGIGLGLCTVILWTPYPHPPGEAHQGLPAYPGAADPRNADARGTDARGTGPHGLDPRGAAPGDGRPGGLLPAPAHDAVRGRLTDAMLARALTDEVLAARLIDEVIASLPAGPSRRARKPRVYPSAVIPFGHGLAAMATFVLAVMTAAGAL